MVSIEFDDPIWLAFGSLSVEPQVPTCRHCGVSGEKTCLLEGAMVCTACHSVVGRQIDYGAEWRYYGVEYRRSCNPARCCPPMTTTRTNKNAHEVQVQLLGSIVSRGPRRNASRWYRKTEAMSALVRSRNLEELNLAGDREATYISDDGVADDGVAGDGVADDGVADDGVAYCHIKVARRILEGVRGHARP